MPPLRLTAPLAGVVVTLAAALAAAPAFARVETVSRGPLTASFSYDRTGEGQYENLRLSILRNGTQVYDAPVSTSDCQEPYCAPGGFGDRRSVAIGRLDGDRTRDVVVDLFTGGAHCCTVSQLVLQRAGGWVTDEHNWGDPGYRLGDPNHDGRREFVTADDRFAYAFTAYAFSGLPVRILSYRHGRFRDVTDRYRHRVRVDARRWWRSYHRAPADEYPQGVLAAWAADQYRLSRRHEALRYVRRQARHGKLRAAMGKSRAARWPDRLDRRLRRWGY
jgi:hypothetical protein